MKKKKYKVSLAMMVPLNFEIETEALSKTEAINIAIDKYNTGNYGSNAFTDPDWVSAKLDIGKDNRGVCVEELSKD